MSLILPIGAVLSLDGLLYARTLSDVVLLTLVFAAVLDVLLAIVLGSRSIAHRSSIDVTPFNVVKDYVQPPLVEE